MIGLVLTLVLAADAEKKIGSIDFFGQEGLDTAAARQALPFREGDLVTSERVRGWCDSARQAVNATDIAFVCCNFQGQYVIYIGLPGSSIRPLKTRPQPQGTVRLPEDLR
jgi:hypothetical protein